MSDLIRREDVYDVLKKVNIAEMPVYIFSELWNGVRDLPSVEPEVKCQYIAVELDGLKSKTVG